jgi:signal transduction histidine kinase
VLSNLVRNAVQALLASDGTGRIAVMAREEEESWIIEVSDTGPGLPPKAREHLFRPFQGGARKGGSGLGLAIAAELVRGHGGTLDLTRTGPEGTVFVITLPKGDGTLLATPSSEAPVERR